jgi:hypothetical protein
MKKKKVYTFIFPLIVVGLIVFAGVYLLQNSAEEALLQGKQGNQVSHTSPYSGEEVRGIKSLSQDEVEGLLVGEGTPFGGMAKLAELNGYPGPRHVLDMMEEIGLSGNQKTEIEKLYQEMESEAIPLGEEIIELEKEMDDGFTDESITSEVLETKVKESAMLYGQLRFVHLKYHFLTKAILSEEQVEKYNELRGYAGVGNPCDTVPEGHDPELWRLHNNCD